MMKSSFKKMTVFFLVISIAFVFFNFKKRNNSAAIPAPVKTAVALCCSASIPNRFGIKTSALAEKELAHASPATGDKLQSMVWIKGVTYLMGADNKQASADEYPKHKVKVKGFYIDVTEVTNAEFGSFVKATIADNPKGPSKSYDPDDIYAIKRSIRGGSFLCNDSLVLATGFRVE